MSNIPYVDSNGQVSVKVELPYATNVYLLNNSNLQKYRSGQKFDAYGGYYTKSPVVITASGVGRWYLIVEGDFKYRYTFF